MLLAIDSGNTNTVFAVFDKDGTVRGEWRSSTNPNRTADEFAVWLNQLMMFEGITIRISESDCVDISIVALRVMDLSASNVVVVESNMEMVQMELKLVVVVLLPARPCLLADC